MNLIPDALRRTVASQILSGKKNSPTILLGVGLASMVGSTVLACRATLKLEEVLDKIEHDKSQADQVKTLADDDSIPEGVTYTDAEYRQDSYVILIRGAARIVKLYAPAVILGGVGIICLTKSHKILQERNAALTAAYIAVDRAFAAYRGRVVETLGEDVDRDLRYENENIDYVDDETGKIISENVASTIDHGMYARWFDSTNSNFHSEPFDVHNWVFLRSQQNWANDMLRARGHVTLNEVYSMVGLKHTSAGSVVGWIYKRDNDRGDNYIDFGCMDQKLDPERFFNGRDGAILLDFNVDGPIWSEIDESVRRNS